MKNIALTSFYLFISFFSGFAVMLVEIAGAKLLAPIFGNTVYTWSTLIGVVLLALSFGSAIGGWMAERTNAIKHLHIALAISALATLNLPTLGVLVTILVSDMDAVWGSFIFSSILFVIPAITFGVISPIALRLMSKISEDTHVGMVGGFINSSSSIGSFIGTLATGLFLMDYLGIREIYYLTAALIALVLLASMLLHRQFPSVTEAFVYSIVGIFLISMTYAVKLIPYPGELDRDLSYYQELRVVEKEDPETGSTIRYMALDGINHGSLDMSTKQPVSYWQRSWRIVELKSPRLDIDTALFVGGGSYGVPQQISTTWPNAKITVVEIDKNVSDAAKKWFFLDEYPNIDVVTEDARRYMNTSDDHYDFIYLDAYKGRSVPSHLVTQEFMHTVRSKLKPGGIVIANVIGTTTGENTAFFDSILTTISSVFDDIQIYKQPDTDEQKGLENIFLFFGDNLNENDTLIAVDDETRTLLSYYVDNYQIKSDDAVLFTDNFQPVDKLISKMMRHQSIN